MERLDDRCSRKPPLHRGRATPADHFRALRLKNGLFPIFIAIRAYEMKLRMIFWKILWSVSNAASFGPRDPVAIEFGKRALLCAVRLQQLRQLVLQFRIRELRVSYLQCQIGKQGFHLFVATRLRRLEKALDASRDVEDGVRRPQAAFGEFEGICDCIRVQNKFLKNAHADLNGILRELSSRHNTNGRGRH
mgnify:CR=1 FL=1